MFFTEVIVIGALILKCIILKVFGMVWLYYFHKSSIILTLMFLFEFVTSMW